MGLDSTRLDMGVAKASASLRGLKGEQAALTSAMKKAAIGFGLVGAAIAVGAVKLAADYDTSMRKVWSLTEETEATFNKWKADVLDMAGKLPQSAKQMAEAFYWIKSDMPTATDAEQFKTLEIAAKGAVGGIAELSDTTNALVQAQNAYKTMEPQRFMDVMNKSVERGSITLQDFVNNQGKYISGAALANISIEETSAAMAVLTRNAVPADTAAMALNQTIMGFLKPTTDAVDVASKYGIELSLAALRSKGLGGAMMEISQKMPDEELANLFPNIRALKAVLPLGSIAAQEFADELLQMGAAAGATDRMFRINADSIENKWKVAVGKAEDALIKFGTKALPALSRALDSLSRIFEGKNEVFNKFGKILQGSIGVVTQFGKALNNLGLLTPAILGLAAAFTMFKLQPLMTVIGGLAGPILANVGANLSMGFTAATMSVGGFATSLASVGLVALPFAIATGLIIQKIKDADAAGEAAAKTLDEHREATVSNGVSALKLADQLDTLRAEQGKYNAESAEYANIGGQITSVQNQIAGMFPSLVKGWDSERNAILKSTDEIRNNITARMAVGGYKLTKGAATEVQELEALSQSLQRTNEGFTITEAQVRGLAMTMEDASFGNFGDVYGNVYDAYAKSTEDGIRVTKAIITEMKEAGVAGDVIAQMEIQMKNLNEQLERTPNSLQEMNSSILEGRAQWVAALDTMNQKVIEAAQTTGQLPAFVISAFQNADPVISQSAVSLMANFMAAVEGGIDPGAAQQIAQTLFDTGTFTATSVASINAALAQIAAQIKTDAIANIGAKLSDAWGKVAGVFAGGPEKKEVEVVITETGSTQAIKGLGEVNKLIGRVDGKKAETKVTADTKKAKKSVDSFIASLPKTYQLVVTTLFKINPEFNHPQDAGKYIGEQFAAGMGTPQLDIDADSALKSVLDAFGANVEGGFLQQAISKEFREVEEAIMAITAQSGAHLGAWRNLRAEMDQSKGTLDKYNASMDASQNKVEALQREQQKLQESISASNEKISKANELLSKMGQIKLKGEGAADEKSYQLQLQINKLELERLNINEKLQAGKGTNEDYDRLYAIAGLKRNLEEEKAIVDLQSTVTYDAQRHAVEAALDPLKGQEMTQWQILKTIKEQQAVIATENASIAKKELALKGIEAQIRRELDAQWLLKIEIENTQKVYDNLRNKVDEFANYFKSRYQEMQTEAQELAREQEKALKGGTATIDTEYKANPTFKHPADLVKYINRTLSSGLEAQKIAINAPVPGMGIAGAGTTNNSSKTEIFHVDTIIMNGVQDIDEMVRQAKLKAQVI